MLVVCAWCRRVLGAKDSEVSGVTHGICPACRSAQEAELDRLYPVITTREEAAIETTITKATST